MYLEYVLHPQELAQYERDVTQLTTEVEQLRKEKANLLGEVEAHKLTVSSYHVIVMHVLLLCSLIGGAVLTSHSLYVHIRSHDCYIHSVNWRRGAVCAPNM